MTDEQHSSNRQLEECEARQRLAMNNDIDMFDGQAKHHPSYICIDGVSANTVDPHPQFSRSHVA